MMSALEKKEYNRQYYEKNKKILLKKNAKYYKKYYKKNKEEILERNVEYYQNNKKHIIKRTGEYQKNNKDKVALYKKKHKEKDLEKYKAYYKKWYQDNRIKRIEENAKMSRYNSTNLTNVYIDSLLVQSGVNRENITEELQDWYRLKIKIKRFIDEIKVKKNMIIDNQ